MVFVSDLQHNTLKFYPCCCRWQDLTIFMTESYSCVFVCVSSLSHSFAYLCPSVHDRRAPLSLLRGGPGVDVMAQLLLLRERLILLCIWVAALLGRVLLPGWQCLSFSIFSVSFHSLLACRVSGEKSADHLQGFLCRWLTFSPGCLSDDFSIIDFCAF